MTHFVSTPTANDIQVDSDTDELVYGTGHVGSNVRRVPRYLVAQCFVPTAFDTQDRVFFVADRRYIVRKVYEAHAASETGGALVVNVAKCATAEVPTAGDTILVPAFNLAAAATVTREGVLSASVAELTIDAGQKLALVYTGSASDVTGIIVTVYLEPL